VRETAEGKPVEIGRLQRFATDAAMAKGKQPFARCGSDRQAGGGGRGRACGSGLRASPGHAWAMT
jgi:dihydropyrimidine dehydrogenase (NAD+) subunit PreT